MPERINWLDIAKGITIMLMIAGHSSIPDVVSRIIYSFHMPLFFISTGMVTNWSKYDIKDFLLHKFRTLVIPFVIYSVVVYMLLAGIHAVNFIDFICRGWEGYALWFIPVLFFAVLLVRIVNAVKNKYMRIIIMLLLFTSGAIMSYMDICLPWTLSTVPYAAFLIYMGKITRSTILRFSNDKRIYWLILPLTIIVLVISHYWRLDMAWNNIIPVIPITAGAFSGTALIYIISVIIEKHFAFISRILQNIGKETFVIMAFSQIIVMILNKLTNIGVAEKYILLALMLILIVYVKNSINKLFKTRLL